MADDIYIVSAVRTPIGKFCNGGLSELRATELGGIVIREALSRANVDPGDVSEVIMGQVLTAGQGQNPARQAARKANIPYEVPAYCVNMLCGSGIKSVILGYQAIRCNDAKIVVCGGQESMSQAHHSTYSRRGVKLGNFSLTDTMICDGLTDAFLNVHMGETAEIIADECGISRQQQDQFSLQSQKKAQEAIKSGKFTEEIVPVVLQRSGEKISNDEYPQFECTIESLEKLKPAFRPQKGTVTAGNASGLNDGAAALVLMSKTEADKRSLQPLGRIVAFVTCGLEPQIMGLGPVPAIKKLLSKTGWDKDKVDLYEINEAFASQSIAVVTQLGIDERKVNTRGGAIALGHPIGASGARVIVTLLYALKQTGGKQGIAALCVGGGMGIAIAIERIEPI